MRTFFRYLFYLALVVFVITLSGYLYVFQFGGLENIVNNKISSLIDEKYLLDIDINEINGSYLSGFTLHDINVYYNDSLNRYKLLRISEIKTAYSFSNIWDKKYMLDFLTIDSAEITLIRDSSDTWIIPDFRPKEKSKKSLVELPSFSIGALDIRNMSLTLLDKGDSINVHDIFIALELKGEENTYAFDVNKFKFSSNQNDIVLNAAGGQITFDDNNLIFKDVALITANTRLKLDGNINLVKELNGEIDFAIDNVDLAKIAQYVGPKLKGLLDLNGTIAFTPAEIKGTANLAGQIAIVDMQNLYVDFSFADKKLVIDTLVGTVFGECNIDGVGYMDFSQPLKTYHLNADIKQFNLKNLVKNSFTSNLSGSVVMDGEGLKKENLLLKFETDFLESQFDIYPIHEAHGNFNVTTDSITFLDSFQVKYYENIFRVSGNVAYRDEMNLKVTADLQNLDRYQQKLFIDQPGGRGYAEAVVDGKTSDPNLEGYFVSDSVWIYGLFANSMFAKVDIDQFLHAKQGMVEVDFLHGSAWAVPYDAGYALLTIDSNIVYIDTSSLENKFTKLFTTGQFDYEAKPNLLTLDSLYISLAKQSFYNRDKIIVEVDSLGFNLTHASIGYENQWLAVNGRSNFDESLDLIFSVNQIPIEPWKNLYEDSLAIYGLLSCEAILQGDFKNPEFVVRGQIDSLEYSELVLGDLNGAVSYKDQKLTIDSVVIFSNPGSYRASGYLYLDLEFSSADINRFPNYPMSIQCNATDSKFDLVSHILPSVEEIKGDFFADFVLSGTPKNPHLEGEAYIKHYYSEREKSYLPAQLKYFDLETPFYTDSAGVTMSDNKILIDGIDIYVPDRNRKRYVAIKGDLTVKTFNNLQYNIAIDIPEAMPFIYELDDIRGKAKGNMKVSGETPPLVTGDIEITEMKYEVNFAEEDQGSPIMLALEGENSWDLNLNIEMLANYWIKNDDIAAEFAGEMNLKRTDGVYKFAGEMEILRGDGYLFDKTFRLDPGGLVIFEGDDQFNPNLDLTGYTRLPAPKDNLEDENSSEQLKLGIHITGTLEEPFINVTEDSDFESNENIIPLIVANYSGDATEVSSSFEHRINDLITTQVSQIGTKQLGVETFEINPHFTGGTYDPRLTTVTLGKYFGDVYFSVGSDISWKRNEYGFEYRIIKGLILQGIKDEDDLQHLNLKLHLEF